MRSQVVFLRLPCEGAVIGRSMQVARCPAVGEFLEYGPATMFVVKAVIHRQGKDPIVKVEYVDEREVYK